MKRLVELSRGENEKKSCREFGRNCCFYSFASWLLR